MSKQATSPAASVKITLRNEFHGGREAVVIAKKLSAGGRCYAVSARAWAAAQRKLCGVTDCRCGGMVGNKSDFGGLHFIGDDHDGRSLFSLYAD